jgi:exopolysaccharide biosynthesis polyprenyl glycosylphosphotransferase
MTGHRRNDVLVPLLMVTSDFLIIVGVFLLAYLSRFSHPFIDLIPITQGLPPMRAYLVCGLIVAPIWMLFFNARGVYHARRNADYTSELFLIIRIVSFGMLVVMSLAFLYREFSFSRMVFAQIWVLSIICLFLGRVAVFWYERLLYRHGKELRNVLVIGTNAVARTVALWISQRPGLGYRLVGYLSDEDDVMENVPVERLGPIDMSRPLVSERKIETMIVCLNSSDKNLLGEIVESVEGQNVQLLLQPDILGITPTRLRVRELFGLPFLGVKDIPMSSWGRIAKRAIDIAASSFVLLLFLPFGLLIALAIWLESRGPVFYRQVRVGLYNREFMLWKFRTMVTGAERESGPTWTKRGDPRVTRLGRVLRRFSIDEIPQFVNVLLGDMSIVGPRPERPEFVMQFREYVPKYVERHRLKCGITGWAQVSGLRGEVPITERTKYDLYYIEHWSLRLDVQIMLRTLYAVLFGKDAY